MTAENSDILKYKKITIFICVYLLINAKGKFRFLYLAPFICKMF